MIYKELAGQKVPELGFGAMRLPTIDGDDAKVDEPAVQAMVDYAMEQGVNYFDTGWSYHGGNCEAVMGRALAKYPRDSFYYAAKFPGYSVDNFGKVEKIFNKQLENAGLEYFDFYLLHNVCELNIEQYLDEDKYHTVSYLLEQKAAGKIKHFGLSAHGNFNTLTRVLEKYGQHFEFCQLQVNWLDWNFQEAAKKIDLCQKYGLPVIVMEPLRGGKLVNRLSDDDLASMDKMRPGVSPVEWSFRFLQGIPNVAMVLSGLSSMDQAKDNIRIFSTSDPLNDDERRLLFDIAERLTSVDTVPCTACHYCTTHCPKELDIPWLLELYNEDKFTEGGFIAPMALGGLPEEKRPEACIACRSCEAVCPQQIKISEVLADMAEHVKAWG